MQYVLDAHVVSALRVRGRSGGGADGSRRVAERFGPRGLRGHAAGVVVADRRPPTADRVPGAGRLIDESAPARLVDAAIGGAARRARRRSNRLLEQFTKETMELFRVHVYSTAAGVTDRTRETASNGLDPCSSGALDRSPGRGIEW